MPRTITDPYEAYQFLYHHPNGVNVDPDHPLVDTSEYAHEGFGTTSNPNARIGARDGKPRDAEYDRAFKEHASTFEWEGQFIYNLDIMYVKVNPATNSISDRNELNTQTQVWLETGPAYFSEYSERYERNMHDTRLDCGGDTFDLALINLANLVLEHYGDYERE